MPASEIFKGNFKINLCLFLIKIIYFVSLREKTEICESFEDKKFTTLTIRNTSDVLPLQLLTET